jgi:hypothetical protein
MRAHVKSSFGGAMIGPVGNLRVYLACGVTDMRKGFDTLAAQMQTLLKFDPHNGELYAFCGRRGAGGHSIGCTLNNTKEKKQDRCFGQLYRSLRFPCVMAILSHNRVARSMIWPDVISGSKLIRYNPGILSSAMVLPWSSRNTIAYMTCSGPIFGPRVS